MKITSVKEKFSEKVTHFGKHMVLFFKWMLISAVAGCAVGLISSLFALLLGKVTALRTDNSWLIFCLPPAGLLIVFLYRRILGEDGGTNLVLSTIHGSKGLEYDRVILMDVADGLLPQNIDPFTEEGERQLEEERRLFYVAMTRAKNHLEVLSCRNLSSSFASQLFPEEKTSETRAVPKPSRKLLPKTDPELFTVGAMVRHKQFGRGLICSRSGDIVLIRFDDGQQKRIALHTALRAGMLKLDT